MSREEELTTIQKLIRKKGDEIVGPPRKMNVNRDKFETTVKVGNDNNDDNKSFSERFLEERVKELEKPNNEEQPIENKGPSQKVLDELKEEYDAQRRVIEEHQEGGKKKTKKRKGKRKSGKKK